MSIDVNLITGARAKVAQIVQMMLDGECSYIAGSRYILPLLSEARIDSLEEPFVAFVAINSETDVVPLARFRGNWDPDAMAKHVPEWDRLERWAKTYGERACRETLAWLQMNPLRFP